MSSFNLSDCIYIYIIGGVIVKTDDWIFIPQKKFLFSNKTILYTFFKLFFVFRQNHNDLPIAMIVLLN